jgi:hypothetical protein
LFNFKASGIAAATAFALSLLVGVISGSGFLAVLLRAILFGTLFFALTCLVFWLLGQFVPELLIDGEDDFDIPSPGSHVNISVGGPMSGAFPTDNSETVDDIGGRSFAAAPLDQSPNAGYTGDEELSDGLESPLPGRGGPSLDTEAELLPDMDGLSEDAPQAAGVDMGVSFDTPETKRSVSASNRGKQALGGDFNPKELAQAIRTVLKKDEKG